VVQVSKYKINGKNEWAYTHRELNGMNVFWWWALNEWDECRWKISFLFIFTVDGFTPNGFLVECSQCSRSNEGSVL